MRILVTDCMYKHSLAIQRYLHRTMPEVQLLGHTDRPQLLARLAGTRGRRLVRGSLEDALGREDLDMVIPVGGTSVRTVSRRCPEKAVLPSFEVIEACYDKLEVARLAAACEVPTPATWGPTGLEEALALPVRFPCVIKSRDETCTKFVEYANDRGEYEARCRDIFGRFESVSGWRPLVQEYVQGRGVGFFALYDRGVVKRVFMHRRIREWPPSGGASTAAAAFWHDDLKDYGTRLLDALGWHGVAMVEFKWDERSDKLWLIEINGKFWGSSELAHRAGVNFAADLVRVYRGDEITVKIPSPDVWAFADAKTYDFAGDVVKVSNSAAGFSTTYKKMEFHGEGVYNHSFGSKDDNFISYLAGFSYNVGDFVRILKLNSITLYVDYAGEEVTKKQSADGYIISSRNSRFGGKDFIIGENDLVTYLSVGVTADLNVHVISLKQLSHDGMFNRIIGSYRFNDSITCSLALDLFSGSMDNFIGRWDTNDRATLLIDYHL